MLSELISAESAPLLSTGLLTELPPLLLPDTAEWGATLMPMPSPLSAVDEEALATFPGLPLCLEDHWPNDEAIAAANSPLSSAADPLLAWGFLKHAQQQLSDFLRSPQSAQGLTSAFGEMGATGTTQSLIQQLIQGDRLPKLAVLEAAELSAQGAYAAEINTIFLAKTLFGRPQELLRVFLEELGHYIDAQINVEDAAGDEGAIFAAQVLGDRLTADELAALKGEDDSAMFTFAGQTLSVERADFGSGTFTVAAEGQVVVEFLVDSGAYQGQLAIFNLDGMEGLTPGSPDFIREAARRALSNSTEGVVVINDIDEGASLTGQLGESDRNSGTAAGAKGINFPVGAHLAVMLVPNGTVADVFNNPATEGRLRPLFSLASANPEGQVHIAEVRPNVYAMEDIRADAGSDFDFNDVIFLLQGATAQIESINTLEGKQQIWLNTPLGQQLLLVSNVIIPPSSGSPDEPIFIGSDNPIFPPIDSANLRVSIPDGVAKFDANDTEAQIAASGAARITLGTQTIYIGTNQVSSINQNPIVASFDSANPANNWVRTDYEVTGADGRGIGIATDGQSLYAVFTVDGTQGSISEDFRRAAIDAEQAWLRSYGSGGGAKVSVLGRIDPTDGELLDAAYLSAILSSGNSNTLVVENLATNSDGNLVVNAQSYFSPRRPNGSALTQITSGSSPFAYTVEITPDLKRVVSTSAVGWA